MQIAETITFKRAGKNSRRIVANLTADASNLADIIAIDGTEDFRRVNKDLKQWNSRCKYNTLAMTLLYLDLTATGLLVERVSYDSKGNRISTVTEDAIIVDLAAKVDPETLNVTLSWNSTIELKVRQYTCFREDLAGGEFKNCVNATPIGAGSAYSVTDEDEKDRGTYDYIVYAQLQSTDPLKENGKLIGFLEDVVV